MGTTITPRQKTVLDFVRAYIEDHDYSPSYREIAQHLGLKSVATVAEHINSLQDKGLLNKDPLEARSIQVTPTWDERTFSIPLMGAIAAGSPIAAIRTNETIDIPRSMMGPDVFALRVRGDSMIDDGILDGDYVVIQKTDRPKNGDIVVAMLEEENVTLKRFYKERDRIRLQPANPKYPPIHTNHVDIQGKVLGVIRMMSQII
ncbi:transcriptional repressor LexA [Candidatus Berkelbacteria bacterium]|nr:transcriptional repressor LexA [Candidatus Berkelbacteria bacterium]